MNIENKTILVTGASRGLGHTLAFAFLMNSVFNTDVSHKLEASMAVTLARYNG